MGASSLPGKLALSEGQVLPKNGDVGVDEAYEHSGIPYDFYDSVFQRNSLDGAGIALVPSVHMEKT